MCLNYKYIFVFMVFLSGCTGINVEYRDNGENSGSDICSLDVGERLVSLQDEYLFRNSSPKSGNDIEARKLECSHQRVKLAGIETAGLSGEAANLYNTYDLNFLEFSGSDGSIMDQSQLDGLIGQIRGDEDTYLIAFVHGWRHNADIANNDVRKFKTLLTYSRQFLNQRVRENGRYRNHRLIGLFIGWRGQVFDEPERPADKDPSFLETLGSVATIPISEKNSLKVAPYVYDALRQISDTLDLGDGYGHDKFLVYGHSFGGNVLSTALSDCRNSTYDSPRCYQDAVSAHVSGSPMRSLLGDLVVLINPAASAWKWTDIQRAVDQRQADGGRIFSTFQKPVYMAFTATANWGDNERLPEGVKVRKKLKPDNATRVLFPAYRMATGQTGTEERIAIGHLAPQDSFQHYGTSHDFITNFGSDVETKIESALRTRSSKCDANDGWLARTRQKSDGNDAWDSGHKKDSRQEPEAFASISPKVDYQFRSDQYFALKGGKHGSRRFYYEPYFNIPFWNVRAFESVINSHGSYVNYPFWCAVNQIVLDDITRH